MSSVTQVSKDRELIGVVVILVFIDLLVLSLWTAVDRPKLKTHTIDSQVSISRYIIV